MVKCFIKEVSGKISVNQYIGQSIAIYAAAPREHLGGLCLAQGHLVVVLSVERALDIHFPHLQFQPGRESNSQPLDYWIISPTL